MAWFIGIDIGSVYSKGVITRDNELSASYLILSGGNYRTAAERIRQELLKKMDLTQDDIDNTVATGSGAGNVYFASHKVSDIVCTARGINSTFPSARTVIEVAGQSSKVMRIDEQGLVANFVVSEKCAAGSGWFIEVIANVLRVDLADFGPLSFKSKNPIAFSTGCAVFGESEAITRVAAAIPKEDIASGVNKALADKISSLAKRIRLEEPCGICGGGALNIGLIEALEHELNVQLLVTPQPQMTAALGAALLARMQVHGPA
ncbi:MAG: 2-hydroxyglutaryl-CoA dehydratase [Desulfobacterales bacterium]|nr:2-hydroxyglutaryl-CoA dehydratase [Desulfobacterales bacterium]